MEWLQIDDFSTIFQLPQWTKRLHSLKDLAAETGNYIQPLVAANTGKESEKKNASVRVTESLCCPSATNTVNRLHSSAKFKNKNKNKNLLAKYKARRGRSQEVTAHASVSPKSTHFCHWL